MSTLKIRNSANNGWLSDLSKVKIRNAANTGWIQATSSNLKVRNSTNNGWLTLDGGGGGGTGTITGVTMDAGLVRVMDLTANPAHTWASGTSYSYGLWCDGPPYPYKNKAGDTYFNVCHSENYRFKVTDWADGTKWTVSGPVYVTPRETAESAYNNRTWLYGCHAIEDNVYALCHHEWYESMITVGGIKGFNSRGDNRDWINAVVWLKSTNGGASWSNWPTANSERCVLIPEPSSVKPSLTCLYGFFHPSNIVKEGTYYYSFVDIRTTTNTTGDVLSNSGICLIRTDDLTTPLGWEFWNGTGWTTISHSSYQGNSGQLPFIFFASGSINPYETGPDVHMGQNLRYHVPTSKWIIFGSSGNIGFAYSTSSTLANPTFTTKTAVNLNSSVTGLNGGEFSTYGGRYVGVFDPTSSGQNFEFITGNKVTVVTTSDWSYYYHSTATISYT